MTTRRTFPSAAVMGTAAAAFTPLFAQGQFASGAAAEKAGTSGGRPLPTNERSTSDHYRPPYRIGMGGVPIGNGFKPTTDAQAQGAQEAAWAAGVRYYDTSPWYGLGLSERRFGHFLHNHTRDDYVLSTKVGRILKASETLPRMMWKDPSPFSYEYDYTAAGVRRSVEDSLQRLGISRIDIVFIHDLSPDNAQYGTDLRTAALQFCNAPPTVSVVTPGARDAQQARENAASMQTQIPPEFWTTLKREGLIAENAPVPQTA